MSKKFLSNDNCALVIEELKKNLKRNVEKIETIRNKIAKMSGLKKIASYSIF